MTLHQSAHIWCNPPLLSYNIQKQQNKTKILETFIKSKQLYYHVDHNHVDHNHVDHSQLDHNRLDHNWLDHNQLDHNWLDQLYYLISYALILSWF